MRTRLARQGAAVAALSLALCTPTAHAAPAPDAAGAAVGTDAESAGAALAARRAAATGLDFRACPDVEELPGPVRCATLRVPLDYARPDGPQIALTVSRVTATRARGAVRQGALVHNPGGPGASGMSFPLVAELPAWERIAAAYDLVGYAPRGVGRSAPLSCQAPSARTTG
ncbi:alpha/beta hydrolase, partial [Streptomyces sp. MB09-01]|nr:alpha/beta hydrolase [Streptomyces sp. MB09-01]